MDNYIVESGRSDVIVPRRKHGVWYSIRKLFISFIMFKRRSLDCPADWRGQQWVASFFGFRRMAAVALLTAGEVIAVGMINGVSVKAEAVISLDCETTIENSNLEDPNADILEESVEDSTISTDDVAATEQDLHISLPASEAEGENKEAEDYLSDGTELTEKKSEDIPYMDNNSMPATETVISFDDGTSTGNSNMEEPYGELLEKSIESSTAPTEAAVSNIQDLSIPLLNCEAENGNKEAEEQVSGDTKLKEEKSEDIPCADDNSIPAIEKNIGGETKTEEGGVLPVEANAQNFNSDMSTLNFDAARQEDEGGLNDSGLTANGEEGLLATNDSDGAKQSEEDDAYTDNEEYSDNRNITGSDSDEKINIQRGNEDINCVDAQQTDIDEEQLPNESANDSGIDERGNCSTEEVINEDKQNNSVAQSEANKVPQEETVISIEANPGEIDQPYANLDFYDDTVEEASSSEASDNRKEDIQADISDAKSEKNGQLSAMEEAIVPKCMAKALPPVMKAPAESIENDLYSETLYEVSDFKQLREAIDTIDTSGTIVLQKDMAVDCLCNISNGKIVTILGNDHEISNAANYIFNVSGGAILNLGTPDYKRSLKLKGREPSSADCLVTISGSGPKMGGTVNIYDGVTLYGNNCGGTAGGIAVQHESVLNMYGGTISDCSSGVSGGVIVGDDSGPYHAVFNMYGGTIDGCVANESYMIGMGGGVYVQNGSTFNMSGGSIKSCTGIYGGGICASSASGIAPIVNITGGSIEGNKATYGGGIFSDNAKVDLSCNQPGRQVAIEKNTADEFGGGIFAQGGNINSETNQDGNNVNIQHNTAAIGGGITINGNTIADFSKSVICNNHASYFASDVYSSSKSTITLQNAKEMHQYYEAYGSDEVGKTKAGKLIDNWYEDYNPRYVPGISGTEIDVTYPMHSACLVASYKEKESLQIKVTGENTEYTYDGNDHSATVSYKYSLGGGDESETCPEGITISLKEGMSASVTGKNAGTYQTNLTSDSFLVTGENADKYDLTFQIESNAVLQIDRRPVTVTVNDAEKIYGNPDPSFSTKSIDGILPEESKLLINYEVKLRDGIENAGEYPGTIQAVGEKDQGNYTVTYKPGKLTIKTRKLTITSGSDSKAYDGTPLVNNTVTVASDQEGVTGFADNEGATFNYTGRQTDAGESWNFFTYELNPGTKCENYDIRTAYGKLAVNQAGAIDLKVSGYNDKYDGRSHSISVDRGTLPDGTILKFSTDGKKWAEDNPALTDVGESMVYVKAENPNYQSYETVNKSPYSAQLKVTPRPVTVKAADAEKTYGEPDPAFSAAVEGIVKGEPESLISYRIELQDFAQNAGDYPGVIQAVGETEQGNYSVSYEPGTLTIKPARSLDISIQGYDNAYDGNSHSINVTPTVSEGTTYQYKVDDGAWEDQKPSFKDASSHIVTVRATNHNYVLVEKAARVIIDPRKITLKSKDGEKIYDGVALKNKDVTISEDGFVAGEGLAFYEFSSITDAGETENRFSYNFTRETNRDNYEIHSEFGKLQVHRRPVRVTAADVVKTYGEADPVFSANVEGIADGEPESKIKYTISKLENTDNAGAHTDAIQVKGESEQGNYLVSFEPGDLVVNRAAALGVEVAGYHGLYDGQDHTVKIDSTYLPEGTSLLFSTDGENWSKEKPVFRNAGSGKIYVKAVNTNYEDPAVPASAEFVIGKRKVRLESGSRNKTYDGTPLTHAEITRSGEGFVDGEGLDCAVTGSQTEVGRSRNEFTYTFSDGTNPSNYDIETAYGTLEVKAAEKTETEPEQSAEPIEEPDKPSEPGEELEQPTEPIEEPDKPTEPGEKPEQPAGSDEKPAQTPAQPEQANEPEKTSDQTETAGDVISDRADGAISGEESVPEDQEDEEQRDSGQEDSGQDENLSDIADNDADSDGRAEGAERQRDRSQGGHQQSGSGSWGRSRNARTGDSSSLPIHAALALTAVAVLAGRRRRRK